MTDAKNKCIRLSIPTWPEIICASYRNFNRQEKHITRICDFYVLIFMLERYLYFTEDGRELELEKGDWYIQSPGLLQQGLKGCPAPSYYYIHFSAQGTEFSHPYEDYTADSMDDTKIFLKKYGRFDIKRIKPVIEQLDFCYRTAPFDRLNLQSLFLSVLNNLTFPSPKEEGHELARKVILYISENYNKDINCDRIAENFHFSTEYINRRLKQYCGLSPGQYLQQVRLARAMELLSNTDHILPYIASEVGYHDVTVFQKAFRKAADMSPGRWRMKSRGMI